MTTRKREKKKKNNGPQNTTEKKIQQLEPHYKRVELVCSERVAVPALQVGAVVSNSKQTLYNSATRTPPNTGIELMSTGRVDSSYSIRGTVVFQEKQLVIICVYIDNYCYNTLM